MSIFDPKTKFLVLGDKPLDNIIDKYEDSDQYKSYMKYVTKGVEEDIREILIPLLNETFKDKDIEFSPTKSIVKVTKKKGFKGDSLREVTVQLMNESHFETFAVDGPEMYKAKYIEKLYTPFTLMTIPDMDRSGILSRRGKKYVVLNTIALDDSITFDGSKLKFVDDSHSLTISGNVNPKVEMFSKSITVIDFVTMLAIEQYGKDKGREYAKRFIYSLTNQSIIASVSGTDGEHREWGKEAMHDHINQMVSVLNENKAKEFQIEEKIEEGYLDTTTTRQLLNDMFSFRNAKGRTISRDIVSSDGVTIAEEGDRVSELIISKLNNNFIDTIHVRKPLRLIGYYIATPIFLGTNIIKGTPIIQEMRDLEPWLEDYMEAPRDIELKEELLVYSNRMIDEELSQYLDYIGRKTIEYKDKPTSAKILEGYFEEEYINNRHFPIKDLDIYDQDIDLDDETYDSYIYVDDNGNKLPSSNVLTCHDMAALMSLFLKLRVGEHHDLVSDPDAGLRKKIDQTYNHFSKAFKYAIRNFAKSTIKYMYNNTDNRGTRFTQKDKMDADFKYFTDNFWSSLYSQQRVIAMLDTSNPVATVSSLTKVNTIVKDADSISDSMRGLSMGHYGRICPYETPQSKKLGVVNNTALGCTIEDGVIYTNYYKLRHENGRSFIDGKPIKMNVVDEEQFRISDISVLDVNQDTGEVKAKGKVPARVPALHSLEKTVFANINLEDVQYISTSPNQHESAATTTIPFAGADDATRVSFGLSMVKQAKGLVNGEIPLVCTTGYLNIPNMNDYYKIFAEKDGRVISVNPGSLTILYDGERKPTRFDFEAITIAFDTAIMRVVEVAKKDRFKKGQTLLSSNFIKDDVMVLGVNAIVAYMTDGFNYEDGVPVGRRLSEKLTSYGVHKEEFPISRRTYNTSIRDVRYGDYINEDDRMFIKRETASSDTAAVNVPVYSKDIRGYIVEASQVSDEYGDRNKSKSIRVQSVSFDELNESDKLCNRHGNKGVTCKVHDNSDMPYFENGEFIDIKYNPNGIVSRMNIGQVLEATGGLACYVLGIKILCGSFNSPSTEEIKRLLAYTVDLANEDDMESVISNYPDMPEELHQHCRENIDNIRHWKGTFNKEGKAYLINPISGKRTLTRVNVGVNYVYKLVQEGIDKMHSRGGLLTSSYVEMTASPTKGSSKGGGQKMGYMEIDAMASYGASNLLREITNERGDNPVARNNMTVETIHSGELDYMLDERFGMRRSTEYMLQMFRALGLHSEMTENELRLEDAEKRRYYKNKAIKDAILDGDEEELEDDILFDKFFELE